VPHAGTHREEHIRARTGRACAPDTRLHSRTGRRCVRTKRHVCLRGGSTRAWPCHRRVFICVMSSQAGVLASCVCAHPGWVTRVSARSTYVH